MRTLSRITKTVPITLACLLALVTLTGCSVLDSTPVTVPDPEGTYHVNVPRGWSFNSEPGMVSIYADKEVPEDGALERLSVVILTSKLGAKKDTPSPEDAIEEFATWRAESREWKNAKMSSVKKATLGGNPARVMDISGTDKKGVDFKGRYYLTRTSSKEVFVMAVAPADRWGKSVEDLDTALKENWFWHSSN